MVEFILKYPRVFNLWLKVNHGFKVKNILNNLSITPDQSMVEVGCGTGTLSINFPKDAYLGIDIDKKYINYASKSFDRRFEVMSGTNMTFSDNSMDYILLSSVLHHLDNELCNEIFKECKRVLKESGKVVILEPELPPITSFMDWILYKLDRGKFIRSKQGYINLFKDYLQIEKGNTLIPPFWKIFQARNSLFVLKQQYSTNQ